MFDRKSSESFEALIIARIDGDEPALSAGDGHEFTPEEKEALDGLTEFLRKSGQLERLDVYRRVVLEKETYAAISSELSEKESTLRSWVYRMKRLLRQYAITVRSSQLGPGACAKESQVLKEAEQLVREKRLEDARLFLVRNELRHPAWFRLLAFVLRKQALKIAFAMQPVPCEERGSCADGAARVLSDDALRYVDRGLVIADDSRLRAELLNTGGAVFDQIGQYDSARGYFERAHRLAGHWPVPALNLLAMGSESHDEMYCTHMIDVLLEMKPKLSDQDIDYVSERLRDNPELSWVRARRFCQPLFKAYRRF